MLLLPLLAGDQHGNIRVWDLTANACSCELVPEVGTGGWRVRGDRDTPPIVWDTLCPALVWHAAAAAACAEACAEAGVLLGVLLLLQGTS